MFSNRREKPLSLFAYMYPSRSFKYSENNVLLYIRKFRQAHCPKLLAYYLYSYLGYFRTFSTNTVQ